MASTGRGSTPRASARASETRSPSIVAQSSRATRVSPSVSTRMALAALAQEGGGGVDLGVDPRSETGERRHLGGTDQHVGNRRARGRQDARQPDHRHAGLAGAVDEWAAGAGDDAAGAERRGGVEAGQRLLGVARVAGAENGPLRRRPARQRVAAHGEQRTAEEVAEGGGGQVPSDRRAAHPADHQARGGGRLEPGRFDSPEGVAKVVGDRENVGEHQMGSLSSAAATMPSTVASAATSTPAERIESRTRAPVPIVHPSSRMEPRTSAPSATRQPGPSTTLGPTVASCEISTPAPTS